MTDDERASFERTFRLRYAELCDSAAFYVGSAGEAEEVVQDVFFAIWVRRGDLETRDSMRSYLFEAVRNYALNNSRRASVVPRHAKEETPSIPLVAQQSFRDWNVDKAYVEVDSRIMAWNRTVHITPLVRTFTAPWAHWRGIVLAAVVLLAAALALTIAATGSK